MDSSLLKNTVPLSKVVSQAMLDMYADLSLSGLQQTYFNWASRGMTKLVNEVLKTNVQKVMLKVNRSSNTAILPFGFKKEVFVGVINHYGQKVPLRLRTELTDEKEIDVVECEDKCPKCNANKAVCNELTVTEDTFIVIINNATYEGTTIKKMYPDGRYFLETRTPVLNINTNRIEYSIQKKFVGTVSLKPCGCVEETESNINLIRTCRPEIYCNYFAPSCSSTLDAGYMIFEENGYIKFDNRFNFDKVYLEYQGTIPKKNGQYHIPEVCFETLVNYVKFKSVENKKSVPLPERRYYFDRYTIERSNMRKVISRLGLSKILQLINSLPKFEYDAPLLDDCYYPCVTPPVKTPASSKYAATQSSSTSTAAQSFIPFEYSGITGIGDAPTHDTDTYQNDKFKNAIGINVIFLDNSILTLKKGEFSLDSVNGKITLLNGNRFFDTMVLVVPTFFKLI